MKYLRAWREFLNMEGWKNAAPHLDSFDETIIAYLQFYPRDFILKSGGMHGIIVSIQPPMCCEVID